jgi:hypothetical protein
MLPLLLLLMFPSAIQSIFEEEWTNEVLTGGEFPMIQLCLI